ncbi:LAMI_0C03906g1_1 [Lachancea mirantina]|uniref:LAMI_0C03906g1_1 n=1 Tax=Lachancea mirantina TaxID=1230905 RepID=A0A1G4J2F9_9SACH|nr:LAMI_0C03906g1_1 [Lachancea mirantina]
MFGSLFLRNKGVQRAMSFDARNIVLNVNESNNPMSRQKDSDTSLKAENKLEKARRLQRPKPLVKALQEYYDQKCRRPSTKSLGKANQFFNSSNVKFEWSAFDAFDIPGESGRQNLEERIASNSSEMEIPKKRSSQKHLPEVAFLGRCNSGKSTVINNLTTAFSQNKLDLHARVSRHAGFTKGINCFNISGRLRLIDTPGYGVKSTHNQGDLTMHYLRNRRELRRCFLLISAEQGLQEFDFQIIEFLQTYGIPFEIAFTKLDKLRDAGTVHNYIEISGVSELATLPQLLFLSSLDKKNVKRHGIDRLRYAILESCGLA